MCRKSKALPLLFAAILLVSLFSGSVTPVLATASIPLKIVASMDAQTKTATVSVVTTEKLTLSNYDIKLAWDDSAFTLTDIANGQSEKFPNFQANKNEKSADAGKACAAANGCNVSLDSATVLASYNFTVSEDISDGDYRFDLTVLDAADENGAPLSWKGLSTSGTLTVGTVSDTEIKSVTKSGTTVTAVISCAKADSVIWCAGYKENGQMQVVKTAAVIGDGIERSYSFDLKTTNISYIKVFVLSEGLIPLCGCEQI